jgi:hypothetical protein
MLQRTISTVSSTGKALKVLVPLLAALAFLLVCLIPGFFFGIALIPWMRGRAFAVFTGGISPVWIVFYGLGVYELQQLRKRQAAQMHQRQIIPSVANDHEGNTQTSAIANAVAATKQALLSSEKLRRDPGASLVLGSDVSLAFLELFVRENSVDATKTANDVVNAHVKPHTKEIGRGGSGAFVELIGDGKDGSGQRWCNTPTHMLSYSWSYSVVMIVEALQKFEHEHPPSKGQQCNYYFVDQFALNQHEFAKDCTQKQVEDMMLATLKESIRVPAQMICLLHPWQDPVPFRRMWCLFEMYIAITLGAKISMHFPAEDAAGFYAKLQKDEADVEITPKRNTRRLNTDLEAVALVPTIDANQAQATVESDRERIFQEITDSIGIDEFNRQLQEHLEGAMRAAAMEVLLQRGGLESVGAGGSKVTMGMLRAEVEQAKQLLAKGQETLAKGQAEAQESVQKTKQEMQETKQQVQETKQEITVLAAVQEETKQEMHVIAANTDARISALDRKIDRLLALMGSTPGDGGR